MNSFSLCCLKNTNTVYVPKWNNVCQICCVETLSVLKKIQIKQLNIAELNPFKGSLHTLRRFSSCSTRVSEKWHHYDLWPFDSWTSSCFSFSLILPLDNFTCSCLCREINSVPEHKTSKVKKTDPVVFHLVYLLVQKGFRCLKEDWSRWSKILSLIWTWARAFI